MCHCTKCVTCSFYTKRGIWKLINRKQTDLKTGNQETNIIGHCTKCVTCSIYTKRSLWKLINRASRRILCNWPYYWFLIIRSLQKIRYLFPIYQFSDPSENWWIEKVTAFENCIIRKPILLDSWLHQISDPFVALFISFQIPLKTDKSGNQVTHFVQCTSIIAFLARFISFQIRSVSWFISFQIPLKPDKIEQVDAFETDAIRNPILLGHCTKCVTCSIYTKRGIWKLINRKQKDLKTDNQETNNMVIAQNADLHKKRDLKTDNQETDRIWNLINRKQTDLKTDNQESNNMVIAQNALLARFTQKEGSENR